MMTRPFCCISTCADSAYGEIEMIPSPMVFATAVPIIAPRTFMPAAIKSAARGVHALVETEVAIAFAASWKPLV